jgi:DNA-binding LacI/PurR family transcriptional regulator
MKERRLKGVVRTARPPTRTGKIGLRQIAEAAKVSLATASRVANGSASVDPGLRKRVREAATALGIDLSRRNKTKALVFVLSNRDMLHPFHSRILIGAEACCASRGWDMLFLSCRYSANAPWKELHLPEVVQRRDMVRAVILAGTNTPNLLELLNQRGTPFVALGNNVVLKEGSSSQFDAIFSDDIQGAREMTAYFRQLGHQEIWFVGNTSLPWANRCYQGYCQAMKEAGLPPHLSEIDSMDDIEVGYLGTKSVLSDGLPVTAILGATDETAQGVYRALGEWGLQIPDDVSVAGCNDSLGCLLNPPMTTIREFPQLLGKSMVDLVLKKIAHPDLPPRQIVIPTELVKRASCTVPRSQTVQPAASRCVSGSVASDPRLKTPDMA